MGFVTLRRAVPDLREAQWGEWEGKLMFCALWLSHHSWSMAERLVLGCESSLWRHLWAGCAQTQARLGPGPGRWFPAYDCATSLSGLAAVNKLLYGSSISDKPNCPQLRCLGPLSSPT